MVAKDVAQLRKLEEYLNFSLEFASRDDELLLLFSGLVDKLEVTLLGKGLHWKFAAKVGNTLVFT